jgi:hypothetical protein
MFCDAPLILICYGFSLYIAIADPFEMGSAYPRDYYDPRPGRVPAAPDVSIYPVSFCYPSICLISGFSPMLCSNMVGAHSDHIIEAGILDLEADILEAVGITTRW